MIIRFKPRLIITLPTSPLMYIMLLAVTPILLFILTFLVIAGVEIFIAYLMTVVSLVLSCVNVCIVEIIKFKDYGVVKFPFFPHSLLSDRLVISINVGGAIIPLVISTYLILKYLLSLEKIIAFLVLLVLTTYITYINSHVVPTLGVTVRGMTPLIAVVSFSILAYTLLNINIVALSYSVGTLSALIGADILNMSKIVRSMRGLVSIGGAGVFDGIYLTGLLALLITCLLRIVSIE